MEMSHDEYKWNIKCPKKSVLMNFALTNLFSLRFFADKKDKNKEKKHKKAGKKVKEKKEEKDDKDDKEERAEHVQFEETPQILSPESPAQVSWRIYLFIANRFVKIERDIWCGL